MCKMRIRQESAAESDSFRDAAEVCADEKTGGGNPSATPRALKRGGRLAAEYVVKVAVMSAMLTALKFALSFIPNVEVVTLLIMVYAAVFGALYTLPAVCVFCAVEVAIYGFGSWVLLYFVYWPALALLCCALFRRRRSLLVAVAIAAVMSALFGVLSACTDTLFVAVGFPGLDFGAYWAAYYVRGLYFDLVHAVSNFCVVGLLFLPLCAAGDKIRRSVRRA